MTAARRCAAFALCCALAGSAGAHLLDVPPEGSCSPRPLQWSNDAVQKPSDVVPPAFRPGEVVQIKDIPQLRGWLPDEVWERREQFFFEGMQLEIGPCYRRFPEPAYFTDATAANAGHASVDADGNLSGFGGDGLPFAPNALDESSAAAGARLAWDYRYRYQAAGFRGDFRITEITKGGRDLEAFSGSFFYLPLYGVPGGSQGDGKERFAAGGSFHSPEVARGLAWRQYQLKSAEADYKASDDVFVYVPDDRKVRRSPAQAAEGVYVPSFTRARSVGNVGMSLPDGQVSNVGNAAMSAAEPLRAGFVGLLIRPNAYRWTIAGARDVLAPANVRAVGYPPDPSRNFGPSGLSLASDRWDVRRAVELDGERKSHEGEIARVALWIDALTLQPLYWVSREANGSVIEVGIFAHRWSAEDNLSTRWQGNGDGFGVMLPVAESFTVAGQGGGWRRESFVLASEPPAPDQTKDFLSVQGLERKGH